MKNSFYFLINNNFNYEEIDSIMKSITNLYGKYDYQIKTINDKFINDLIEQNMDHEAGIAKTSKYFIFSENIPFELTGLIEKKLNAHYLRKQ
ncbi:MAG: hypothetical protein IKP65_02475 [Alphaproteobacteria bacterium]|nr:hypothetical protein [Alphaproteobacteria bacterium]